MDYASELEAINRRRLLSQTLMGQGLQPEKSGEMVGRYFVPKSPVQGLNKLAQALLGAKGIQSADTQAKDITEQRRSAMSDTLKTAASPVTTPGNYDTEGFPIQQPESRDRNLNEIVDVLGQNPDTSNFGSQLLIKDILAKSQLERQRQMQQNLLSSFGQSGGPTKVSVGPKGPTVEFDALGAAKARDEGILPSQQTAPTGQPTQTSGLSPKQQREIQAKLAEDKPKDQKSLRSLIPSLQRMRDEATAILKDPNLSSATGFNYLQGKIPGTKAKGVASRIETLKAQLFGNVITAMREASKTGGLVGNMSDAEGARFETMVASLDRAQSDEDFADRLQQIINYTNELENQALAGFKDTYGENPPEMERSSSVVGNGSGDIKFLGFE